MHSKLSGKFKEKSIKCSGRERGRQKFNVLENKMKEETMDINYHASNDFLMRKEIFIGKISESLKEL
jgi:hypothetical protein